MKRSAWTLNRAKQSAARKRGLYTSDREAESLNGIPKTRDGKRVQPHVPRGCA